MRSDLLDAKDLDSVLKKLAQREEREAQKARQAALREGLPALPQGPQDVTLAGSCH